MGSKKGRQGQEGMTTVPRAGDGYGPAEHRLMGYDRAAIGGRGDRKHTHTKYFSSKEKLLSLLSSVNQGLSVTKI